jgi:hypothetical protein
MDNLVDFIHVYENSLSDNICDELVSFFEKNSSEHEYIDEQGCPTFTQFNLTKNKQNREKIHTFLVKKVLEYRDIYYNSVSKFKDSFPLSHAFEEFRIKKYNPNGIDRFETHVDVDDYSSSKRFLSFFWYLNDVQNGGETVFNDLEIKPSKGKLVVFPPLWMFPHRGNPPISESKYLLSTYLHYK